ncbi:MAG: CopG family transcriptional regulator [archaeon]
MSNRKRVQVSFTEDQWELIEKLQGKLGDSDSAIVRNIVISWLAEKSFISNVVKEEMKVVKQDIETTE